MTKEPIMIDCEYCTVLGNENKCKALQTETHTCLGITAKNKCPIYKLKQQLKRLDNEYEGFAVKYTDMETALKRKEQECEEWKSKYYNSTTEVKADLIKQLDKLEEENEELKTEFDNFEEQIKLQDNFIDSFLNATNNSEWRNKSILEDIADAIIEKVESDYVQLKKLKQALQEIKDYCNKYPQNSIGFKKQILQKCEMINE